MNAFGRLIPASRAAWITCGEWVPKVYALWEWSHAKRASDEEFART